MKVLPILFHFALIIFCPVLFGQRTETDSIISLLETDKDDTIKVNHLNSLSLGLRKSGNYDKALLYAEQAKVLSEKINFKKGMAIALNNAGNIYIEQGNYTRALEEHFASLKIKEEIGDKQGIAGSYNNIGSIYKSQGNYQKALENLEASMHMREALGDKQGLAGCHVNIGAIYRDQGNLAFSAGDNAGAGVLYEKALEKFFTALKIYDEIGNKQYLAFCYNNIGNIYKEQGSAANASGNKTEAIEKYKKALTTYSASLSLFKENGFKQGELISHNNIGGVYLKLGNADEARKHILTSLEMALESGSKEGLMRNYQLLSACDSTTGNWKNAYANQQLYIAYRDSIDNEQTRKKSLQTELTYQFEKKEALAKAEQAKKDAVAAEEKQKEKTIRYSVIVGLLLVLVVLMVVFRSLKVTKKQKLVIEQQKNMVEESRREIVDSINYAKRIQMALLANKELLDRNLPSYFLLFNPKDIVSGDFYWAAEHQDRFYIAVCDSTGHGVPGAFMSLLNIGFLSEAIKEKQILEPHNVLNYVRERLVKSIGNDGQQDGMDAVLICIDKRNRQVTYAAANNEPVLVRNDEIKLLPKDKMPVGKGDRTESFTHHSFNVQPGDTLYLYTDGYADQFGGDKGKKFKYKQLNELLLSVHKESAEKQKEILSAAFLKWKGNLEQVDDVCLAGIQLA